ncbi:MAG: methyl-accepting chemotaxis protein [Oscillospiraceae bacterium]|nr:methyl-accepting chemotaxis protein [Oscillospiraceae bacterium]
MRKLITNDETTCVGCNKCIRACPMLGASIAYEKENQIKVKINTDRCIACGACIIACRHGVRDYLDDTERFIRDLQSGVPISVFAAPAIRSGSLDYERVFSWLRNLGVRKIYDVSLGADICTWANIRYVQKNNFKPVITQPCPAIVNYILLHEHDLIPYLSQAQSPMLCTAIYMKKYQNISTKIAALSPCIAKAQEFEDTGYVSYNITLKKLQDYIEKNNIRLPSESSGFDHDEASMGRVFSMPGGLKENVELYLGKQVRIDQAEGQDIVYDVLYEYAEQRGRNLPVIFDVLNCPEGCNVGTGCPKTNQSRFDAGAVMERQRKFVYDNFDRQQLDMLYEEFDRTLKLHDFLRQYHPKDTKTAKPTNDQIENAFVALHKHTESQRKFDCGACGSKSCHEMAERVVLGFDSPSNCIQREKDIIHADHTKILELSRTNLDSINEILSDVSKIKEISDEIVGYVGTVSEAIGQYGNMSKDISSIAQHINIIALNASVEAARAGEHGKSFAVVANEVRTLAHRSQNTVSQTDSISSKATESVETITKKIDSISSAIAMAHEDIGSVFNNTKEALEDFDN